MTSFRNMASSGKVAFAVAFAAKLFVDALPDALVESVFTRPASRVAAFYLGAAFDPSAMRPSARGVTRPSLFTVATFGSDEAHVTRRM